MALIPAHAHGFNQAGNVFLSNAPGLALNTRLQLLLDGAVTDGLPGVSLRIMGHGMDFQGTAGVANLITGELLTPIHIMYTASLGKTFTAVIALQLCDEGRFDLDMSINNWLPAEM